MKKLLFLSMIFVTISTQAASTTGTLLLQGIVLPIRSVVVTPTAIASTLNLEVTQANLKVATVNEKSNSLFGYKITIQSANLSKLIRSGGTEVFNYTLRYNGIAAPVTTAAGYSVSYSSSILTNVNRDLEISYTGVPAENMVEGTYQDTLTVTISAV